MASNMQKDCVKKHNSTSDIISYLPSIVIENILMRMPIQDAIRTTVLSRKWRYAWVTLPQLVFDYAFYRNLRKRPKDNLMMTIFQVLLFHRGPIVKLQLSLPVLGSYSEIDQLILFVSDNDIQEFILHIPHGEPYELPSSIFSCLQLKRLELHFCLFNPPPRFKVFSRLLSLVLRNIVITSEVFSSLISNCPLLKELELENFITFNFSYLEITAPNLTCLRFRGEFNSICLKNTPKLARVSIRLVWELSPWETYEGEKCNWVTFFSSLPVIESLELNHEFLQLIFADGLPKRLPTDLSHLKILELHLEYVNDVSTILCFLRSSPNLEKIAIGLPIDLTKDEETVIKRFEVEGWSDICLNQLREVELRDAYCTRFELEFIKLILAKSPVLEKMVIESTDLMDTDDLGFLMEVTQFRRLSPLAQVYYYSR